MGKRDAMSHVRHAMNPVPRAKSQAADVTLTEIAEMTAAETTAPETTDEAMIDATGAGGIAGAGIRAPDARAMAPTEATRAGEANARAVTMPP